MRSSWRPLLEWLCNTASIPTSCTDGYRTTTMVQCACIRAVQAQFSITTFEAMRYLDCYDPRARVMQLRNAGEVIDTHWQTIITESGDKHRVGLYAMGRKQ